MSLKACIYKDCTNYTIGNAVNQNFTLFQFPTDKERRAIWMKFGKVPASAHPKTLLLCSDHFPRKFISENPRRRILLGPAIPKPYGSAVYVDDGENSDVQETTINEKILIERVLKSKQVNEELISIGENQSEESESVLQSQDCEYQNQFENSLIKTIDCVEHENNDVESVFDEEMLIEATTDATVTSSFSHMSTATAPKRKSSIEEQHTCKKMFVNEEGTNTMIQKQSKPQQLQQSSDPADGMFEDFEESDLVDDEFVISFAYKGEEQVQMPKNYYMKEKLELLKQIQHYKHTLADVQKIIDNAKYPK